MENENKSLDLEMLNKAPQKQEPRKYVPLEGQEAYQKGSGVLPELPKDELYNMQESVQKRYMKFNYTVGLILVMAFYDIYRSYLYYTKKEENNMFVIHLLFDLYVMGASVLMYKGKQNLNPLPLNLGRIMLFFAIIASLLFYISTFINHSWDIFAFTFVTAIPWIILPSIIYLLSAQLKAEIKRIAEYKKLMAAFEMKIQENY